MSRHPLASTNSGMGKAFLPYINSFRQSELRDKVGIFASGLCAIHCLLTPVLLIFAKDFAGIWAHPAAHWILAAITIPLAVGVIMKGSKSHGKVWVVYAAVLGSLAIIASLFAPMFAAEPETVGRCAKGCCPSVQQSEDGGFSLNFPLASIFSILGGVLLISAHIGNLFYNRCHFNGKAKCPC